MINFIHRDKHHKVYTSKWYSGLNPPESPGEQITDASYLRTPFFSHPMSFPGSSEMVLDGKNITKLIKWNRIINWPSLFVYLRNIFRLLTKKPIRIIRLEFQFPLPIILTWNRQGLLAVPTELVPRHLTVVSKVVFVISNFEVDIKSSSKCTSFSPVPC